ncbi:DoxX-like family protein [Pseudochryseolinea flava]|uniref:DoxX family protein n=1 Tax=Pseudochryseolinea flava TaxID=2059302 RepID=A0A364XUT2_9BACT|nr:DoxX-like family protein [Pseudochryseolinea flava]RAV97714.1 hypothetical protein DQQ10_27125 [Pseudochryseolinea flava]
MRANKQYTILYWFITILISMIWLVNGLWCKVLHGVPRHEEIVARILGQAYAPHLTVAIGYAEMLMVVWILTGIWKRFCAVFQIVLVGVMNIIEYVLAPDLLLFGRMNIVFALLFMVVIYGNQFILLQKKQMEIK